MFALCRIYIGAVVLLLSLNLHAQDMSSNPFLAEYAQHLNDPNQLTYLDPWDTTPKLHSPEEYLDKTINEITQQLFESVMDSERRQELQMRVRALRELKKSINN